MALSDEKRRLRREMAARRASISEIEARAAAAAVARRVESTPEFRVAHRVALYAALGDEVPTKPLFEVAVARGKRVLMPRMSGRRPQFAAVERLEALRPGRHGVLEPPLRAPAEPLEPDDLVLVPGVAFDREGNRLGRGGAFYDRAFPPGRRAPALFGVAYAFQVVATVPHGETDRAVDVIVTEAGIHRVGLIKAPHES